jgi:hypothetical protein
VAVEVLPVFERFTAEVACEGPRYVVAVVPLVVIQVVESLECHST